jgi:putative tryptophan/tyrosine transport system substrate-binding protein
MIPTARGQRHLVKACPAICPRDYFFPPLGRNLKGYVGVLLEQFDGVRSDKTPSQCDRLDRRRWGDPVKSGFVPSLNHPSGNLTGVALFAYSLGPKRLELLRELLPNAKAIAMLVKPDNPDPQSADDAQQTETAARAAGLKLNRLNVSTDREIDSAFAALGKTKDDALLVMADPFFTSNREQLVALAARQSIPAIYEWREFAAAGGLMSYGASITDAYRQVGIYTGKILNGAKAADLPVMQAVKVELVINLKAAKALGLAFPITLLGRADEVIE